MEMKKNTVYTFILNETEAASLQEALYAAVSAAGKWKSTESDLKLCDAIINYIGTQK